MTEEAGVGHGGNQDRKNKKTNFEMKDLNSITVSLEHLGEEE